ncbi:MAG: M28 family peptidase [Candidatus Rokuibacteriota bacterium]
MIRRCVVAALVVLLLLPAALASSVAAPRVAWTPPSAAELQALVEALTTPEMDGRRSGTPGGERAARQIAAWLAAAGLRPGGDDGGFFQSFPVGSVTRVGPASSLEATAPARRAFEAGREWTPHGGSLVAAVEGPVVFVGYGVEAPDLAWDDYAGTDARGAVVIALDGTPPHLGARRFTRLDRLILARRHGAAALLFVADTLPQPSATAAPVALVSGTVTRATADALLAPAGIDTATLAARIASRRAPASLVTAARARVSALLARETVTGLNVIGVIPGTDAVLAREALVLGAHYDHLGRVGGAVHPGADDNASGTAVVVGLARALAAAGGGARTMVVALFGGEELGLLGSSHHVQRPTVPLDRTVAMLNFDMVGRLRDGRLMIGGVESADRLRELVTRAAGAEGLRPDLRPSPYGPSDHARFYTAGVPVLFFFTGRHDDYHRPTDTADLINAAGMAQIAAVSARVIDELDAGPRPVYARVARPAREARERGPDPAAGGAFFGIGAAPGESDGVRLSEVIADSAAARAGLRGGDVLVRVDGEPMASFDDLRAALGRRRPGDTVQVVYLRDGADHRVAATLGARP